MYHSTCSFFCVSVCLLACLCVGRPPSVLQRLCISLWGTFIICQREANPHFFGVFFAQSDAPKFRSLGEGGTCILFEIHEKRPFQKCMGLGGGEGGCIFEEMDLQSRPGTQTCTEHFKHVYSKSSAFAL